MTRVLNEQHVHARRRARSDRSGRRHASPILRQRPRRRLGELGSGLRTAFMIVLIMGLATTLIVLVPYLEEGSEGMREGTDVVLRASAPALPSLRDGLVDFELTEDIEYIVQEGETLSEIAHRYDVDYELLADFNGLSDPDTIDAGETIVVPGPSSRSSFTNE